LVRLKQILCLADTTAASPAAMREAALVAEKEKAALTFLYVLPRPDPAGVLFPHLHERRALNRPRTIGEAGSLAGHAAQVTGLPEGRFDVIVETGKVETVVAATADELHCDLVVMPDSGAIAKMIRSLPCAVLVVRENEGCGVLAATDLSDSRFPALHAGKMAAAWSDRALTGIFSLNFPAWTPLGPGGELGAYVFSSQEIDEVNRSVRLRLREAMNTVDPEGREIVEHGLPKDAILHAAARLKSGLIVVGSRDKGVLARLFTGSVAESVAESAPCSVLVVKPPKDSTLEAA
jgi:nucleotide-binding universal stress UspA family protein